MQRVQANNITSFRAVGEITSLVFNPHDDCFYGCNATSNTIILIKGTEVFTYHRFEDNLTPKAIDYYKEGRYFIIVLAGPTCAVYKKPFDGKAVKIAEHVAKRDDFKYPTGVTINQETGDAYISSRNGSVHRLSPKGELSVLRGKHRGGLRIVLQKGLQGILFDHEIDNLLVCDAKNDKIFALNPNTGKETVLCGISMPFQITKWAPHEYLVTGPNNFIVSHIFKEGEEYKVKTFAGSGKRGTIDGLPNLSRFDSPKGIAANSKVCLVGDYNCVRVIAIEGSQFLTRDKRSQSSSPIQSPRFSLSPNYPPQTLSKLPENTKSIFDRPPIPGVEKLLPHNNPHNLITQNSSPTFPPHPSIPRAPLEPRRFSSATDVHDPPPPPSPEGPLPTIQMKELTHLEPAGEGSQGIVYKAKWKGQIVIYKQMRLLIKNANDEKKDFEKEFRVWQKITHQSCVRLYGIVDEGQEFGFIAEYCPNGSFYLFYSSNVIRLHILIIKKRWEV